MEQHSDANFMLQYAIATWEELTTYILQNPDKLFKSQQDYWQLYNEMLQTTEQENNEVDKRFTHSSWQNDIALNFIKRCYFLLTQQIENITAKTDIKTDLKKRLKFFANQYLDLIAPSNFAMLNPEVLEKSIETNGLNLIAGFKQLQKDLSSGKGLLNIKLVDNSAFTLGRNIACTPGKVIYQNDIMQLIYYTKTTEQVYTNPILIIPPWINKYYILDLQQENSLVKWLVNKGFCVFMISWINASAEEKHKTFTDYLRQGPVKALQIINQLTKGHATNIMGYCVGGTLLGCLLAYLSEKKLFPISSATFVTTLLDFSNPGELGTFIDKKQIAMLNKNMQQKGYLSGRILATVFSALRANDLVWSSFVNNYLKGDKPKAFDLLYWNADATNVPARVHQFYLRNMYLNNLLLTPNGVKLAGVSLNLNNINIPSYFLAAQDDHIIPWQSAYASHQLLKTQTKFVLANSGHVAGVINPPHKQKYGYFTANNYPNDTDKFLANAIYHTGSWWNDWHDWLVQHAGKLSQLEWSIHDHRIIEDAPGSYVKVTLSDIDEREMVTSLTA